jgi:uncharacterized surface protein with fasciclin (FAS1) repeats
LFAPNNEAFDQAVIDYQSTAFDVSILRSHIVDRALYQDDFPCESSVTTLETINGSQVRFMCTDGEPTIIQGTGNAINAMPEFVEMDIEACR